MSSAFPVTVDDSRARIKIQGIPEKVRQNLRRIIPPLTWKLKGLVEQKLQPGALFNRRPKWNIRATMNETPMELVGKVFVDPASEGYVYAAIHEFGGQTKAHVISAVNARALYFYWAKVGAFVSFRTVNHPGSKIPERSYMRSSFHEMEMQIIEKLQEARNVGP